MGFDNSSILLRPVGVDHENVFANNLLFHEDGTYAGFDDKELTAWSGGKSRVMQHLQACTVIRW